MKMKHVGWQVFAALTMLITFLCIVSGNFFTKKVSLQIGEIAPETFYAPFQVENEEATKRKQQEAEAAVVPVPKRDSSVQEEAISAIEDLFKNVHAIQTSNVADTLEKTKVEVLNGRSTIGLYNEQYALLLDTPQETLDQMKTICIEIASQFFAEGITAEESNKSIEVRQQVEAVALSASLKKVAEDIINNVLAPNIIEDEVATNEEKKIARDKVDKVYVLPQEKIVEKGTRITEETYKLLDKVGYLANDKTSRAKQYVGTILFILLVSFLYYCYMKKIYVNRYLKGNKQQKDRQLSLALILVGAAMLTARALLGLAFVYLPLGIVCMMIAFAMGAHVAFVTQVIVILLAAIIFKGDIIFILYFMVSGIASTLIVARMHERTKTLVSAITVGGIQFATYLSLKLLTGTAFSITIFTEAFVAFIVGIISVVAVIGALPMFEEVFDFVTPMQLLEMTNPSQPILKRLLIEATGTYYHSLLVANLAEAAASQIGANPLLARVGGYYHDIGKLTCSNYFKENQGANNPHDYMTPKESYEMIVSHVTSGVQLAEAYHLPNYIKDFIRQHHGTSTMQYFYVKAQKASQEVILEKQFQYPGPKPQTKETALVMLADVVEATTRAMQDKLGKEIQIEDLVRKSVKQKLDEGQLSECELYISDIDKIVDSFTKMLTGMYHQRIVYPERNDK